MRRRLRTEVRNVFDTQVAAGFAGHGGAGLLRLAAGRAARTCAWPRARASRAGTRARCRPSSWPTRARTSCTCSSWRASWSAAWPSSGACSGRARSASRSQRSSDERDLETIFARLPRVRGLSASAQTIARELVRWREQHAPRAQDRPVQSVLGDAALVEIAKRKPSSTSRARADPRRRPGQPAPARRRSCWRRCAAARERPPRAARRRLRARRRPSPTTRRWSRSPRRWCARARARRGSPTSCWPRRADLQAIVAARRLGGEEADVRTLRGWRRELVGEELLELLDGRVSLSVHERDRPPAASA